MQRITRELARKYAFDGREAVNDEPVSRRLVEWSGSGVVGFNLNFD